MAVAEIKKIIDEASHRWGILGSAVAHRIGTLKPSEVAVVVAVSAKHRKESFEACQFIIDTIKEKAPIFKKEVFEDGEEWVSATPQVALSNN
jgi:molybdopterin synthase catalytic subunit